MNRLLMSERPLRIIFDLNPEWVPREAQNPVVRSGGFEHVQDFESADVVMLAGRWDWYEQLPPLFAAAEKRGREVIVFAGNDFEPLLPVSNALLFHPGPTRGISRPYEVAATPYFHNDRLLRYGGEVKVRQRTEKPVVGFCGQGASRPHARIVHAARRMAWNLRFRLRKLSFVPPPVKSPVSLRAKALSHLEKSQRLDTEFIIRNRYRAGVGGAHKQDHETTLEYERNIMDTDYTLCVRGSGNFSARLYETLCFGRIPIFVDTNCVLPFEKELDWRSFCVYAPYEQIDTLDSVISDFHEGLTAADFETLQLRCRQVWSEWLQEPAFVRRFSQLSTAD
jgi:hypothetical protein